MNKSIVFQIKGMNALFSLRVRVTVGERLVVGVATATAVFLMALPQPELPRITTAVGRRDDERRRLDAQKLLQDTLNQNKICYGINHLPNVSSSYFYFFHCFKRII